MIRAIWLLLATVVLACDKGVPHVDDPYNIVVNGKKMNPTAFLKKYCIEKENEPTCSKVLHAVITDIRGRVPRL